MAWLAGLGLVNVVLFVLVVEVFVGTIRGQMLDTIALEGNSFGRRTAAETLNAALQAISVVSVALILVTIAVVAVARRRYTLAVMSIAVVVGSCLTTLLLHYHVLTRPVLGVDPERDLAGNSLPSGHATAAAAFAIGLTLVLPPRARGAAGLLGAGYAAVVGVATLSSGWHRPSDVIASYLIAGGWAAFAGLVLVIGQKPTAVVNRRERAEWSQAGATALGSFLTVLGIAVLAFVAQRMSEPVAAMGEDLLRLGYLGSAMVIGGGAYLMMATVLFSVHRVVPHSPGGQRPESAVASAAAGR